MPINDTEFQEQEAPVKNTDDAFVQVGKDGSPVIPSVEKEPLESDVKQQNEEANNATTSVTP